MGRKKDNFGNSYKILACEFLVNAEIYKDMYSKEVRFEEKNIISNKQ